MDLGQRKRNLWKYSRFANLIYENPENAKKNIQNEKPLENILTDYHLSLTSFQTMITF